MTLPVSSATAAAKRHGF